MSQEIAPSIEEINRIRIAAGMTPLHAERGDGGGAARQQAEAAAARRQRREEEEAAQAAALRAKLAKRRKKRLLTQKLQGATLGDELLTTEASSAAAWVARSRTAGAPGGASSSSSAAASASASSKRSKRKTRLAKRQAARIAEEEEELADVVPSELKGVRVGHDLSELAEGEQVVLTFKDTSILDGDKLNEDGDELESVALKDQRRQAVGAARRGRKLGTRGLDVATRTAEDARTHRLLSKYDEEDDDERMMDGGGFRLGVDDEALRKQKEEYVKQRLRQQQGLDEDEDEVMTIGGQKTKYNLAGGLKITSDYQAEQPAAPVKLKKRKVKKKRKKHKRKQIETKDFLDDNAAAQGSGDHGSRRTRQSRAAAKASSEQADARAQRDRNYSHALARAQQTTSQFKAMQKLAKMPARGGSTLTEEDGVGDLEMQQALALARKLENSKARTQISDVRRLKRKAKEHAAQTKPKEEEEEGGILFTDASAFALGLTAEMNDEAATTARRRVKQEEHEVVKEKVVEEQKEQQQPAEVKEEPKQEPAAKPKPQQPAKPPAAALGGEKLYGKGVAAALASLKQRGELGREDVLVAGRKTDKLIEDPKSDKHTRKRTVDIHRYDEFGRVMTPKEAYRELSYRFHNIRPGKAKQEKRLREYKRQLEEARGQRAMQSMQQTQAQQRRDGKAFVVLDAGNVDEDEMLELVKQGGVKKRKKRKKKNKKRKGKGPSGTEVQAAAAAAAASAHQHGNAGNKRKVVESQQPALNNVYVPGSDSVQFEIARKRPKLD